MAKARHAEIHNGILNTAAGSIEFVDGIAELTDEQVEMFEKHPISDLRIMKERTQDPTTDGSGKAPEGGSDETTDGTQKAPTKKAPPKK